MRSPTHVRWVWLLGAVLASGAASCSPGRRADDASILWSVLRTTPPPQEQVAARDALAREQARAAATLLQRGASDTAWTLLRHSEDPTRRSYLVHMLASYVRAEVVIARLRTETDVSARRALILSLGGYSGTAIPQRERTRIAAQLLQWYRSHSDPGVHGAIDWLLRHGMQGSRPRPLDWNQGPALLQIDRQLAEIPERDVRWSVTREGFTMVTIAGPVTVRMGSPRYEPGRVSASDSPDEPLHDVRIPRSFAIASKEVTVAQFQRFLDANPEARRRHAYDGNPGRMAQVMRNFSPDSAGPQIAVTWYEAAMYCNWLSKQDGLPESEWVYPAGPEEYGSGMTLPNDYLHRTGYRLPTEAEWEYAARAGTTTPHFFGIADSLLPEYAWYSHYPQKRKTDPIDPRDPNRTEPVGQLKPNDLGLFDVYGNVWEWTQDRVVRTRTASESDVEDDVLVVTDSAARTRRSGGFPYPAAMMRSAERGTVGASPLARRDNVGFRVARSVR